MAEFAVSGGRDDLKIDASRCQHMRFSESSCRRCAEICPHKAVNLDGILSIDPNHCTGCLLCTAACPVGALEQSTDFQAILTQLPRVPAPVLGCVRTRERSNATLTCMGGLSEEHLVTLCHTLAGELTLNLTACSDCPNSAVIHPLRQRLSLLSGAGLLDGGCHIAIAESAEDIRYHDELVDRRSFFKSLRNSLVKSAAAIIANDSEQSERHSGYAEKRLPVRRELLNRTRKRLPEELESRIRQRFDSCVTWGEACTGCHGCVAICPTGALQAGQSDTPPAFDQPRCTGCGLCSEFCLDRGMQLSPSRTRCHSILGGERTSI